MINQASRSMALLGHILSYSQMLKEKLGCLDLCKCRVARVQDKYYCCNEKAKGKV